MSKKKSFENYFEDVKRIIEDIESGELPLEETVTKWEDGMKSIKKCREILEDAKTKIELISKNKEGETVKKEFEKNE